MEIKINKDIRNYSESIFFGLSMRQFIFSLLACGIAVTVYFIFKPILETETVSWVCILSAVPFAVLGFVKYNGMNAEQFIVAWFKTNFLIPKTLTFKAENIYSQTFKDIIDKNEKRDFIKVKNKKKIRKGENKKCLKH